MEFMWSRDIKTQEKIVYYFPEFLENFRLSWPKFKCSFKKNKSGKFVFRKKEKKQRISKEIITFVKKLIFKAAGLDFLVFDKVEGLCELTLSFSERVEVDCLDEFVLTTLFNVIPVYLEEEKQPEYII